MGQKKRVWHNRSGFQVKGPFTYTACRLGILADIIQSHWPKCPHLACGTQVYEGLTIITPQGVWSRFGEHRSGASSFISLESKPTAPQLEPVHSKRGQSEKLFENLSTVPKQNANVELSLYPVAFFFHKYT